MGLQYHGWFRASCLVCPDCPINQSTLHRKAWIEECLCPAPDSNRSHRPLKRGAEDSGQSGHTVPRAVAPQRNPAEHSATPPPTPPGKPQQALGARPQPHPAPPAVSPTNSPRRPPGPKEAVKCTAGRESTEGPKEEASNSPGGTPLGTREGSPHPDVGRPRATARLPPRSCWKNPPKTSSPTARQPVAHIDRAGVPR